MSKKLIDRPAVKESGINKNYYSDYNFEDHHWYINKPTFDEYLQLASLCVRVDGTYKIMSTNNKSWKSFKTEVEAKREAYNTWQGMMLNNSVIVNKTIVDEYFTGEKSLYTVDQNGKPIRQTINIGSCPLLASTINIPLGPQFVWYDGQKCLNVWSDRTITGEISHLPKGKLVLLMIYRSLCNGVALNEDVSIEADMLLQQVESGNYTNLDFKFVINWLAALVQKPGINLLTNLWLTGDKQGIGKGTLVEIMEYILGRNVCDKFNTDEQDRGWNTFLLGKQLVNIDEFKITPKFSAKGWNNWIKEFTCEPTIPITVRGKDSFTIPNTVNYIITANNYDKVYIDLSDRRNQFIKTSSDVAAVELATAIQTTYVKPRPKEIASGFAFILERVDVDYPFISRAFVNELKADIANSSKNEVQEWIDSDPLLEKGKLLQARALYEVYKNWVRISKPGLNPITETAWGRLMGRSTSSGVKKTVDRNVAYYTINEIVAESLPVIKNGTDIVKRITGEGIDLDNNDVMSEVVKPPKLSAAAVLREKLKQQEAEYDKEWWNSGLCGGL